MHTYPLAINLTEHGDAAASQLCAFLMAHCGDPALKPILNMNLGFISPHARSTHTFLIQNVEHVAGATYRLNYRISYFIFNLCQDMNLEDTYATSIRFDVCDGSLAFDVIPSGRDTVDEF